MKLLIYDREHLIYFNNNHTSFYVFVYINMFTQRIIDMSIRLQHHDMYI